MSEKQVNNSNNSNKIFIALSIFLLVLFCLNSLNNQNIDKKLNQSAKESHELTRDLVFKKRALEKQLYILRCEEYQAIQLNGTDKSPAANVVVLYNSTGQSCYLDVRTLPLLTGKEQYQVWAVVGDTYTAMCTFDRKEEIAEMLPMIYVPNATRFIVSIEPNSGSDGPTLSAVVCEQVS